MSRLLQVTNVGWRAPSGQTILNRVTFTVEPGEFVALMGRNGAGKSTLLDVLAGVRQPAEGHVLFDGRPPSDWSAAELARTVAHLPQTVRADAPFSAEQLVLMGRYPHAVQWVESTEDRAIADRAMEQCGCLEFRHRRAATLSGGERQRVLLASCFAQQPRLFLLDEPATFLDIDHQFHCFSLLREQVEQGAACLAVTHDINFALTFCTRVLVLADGTLVRDLAVNEATTTPDWLALFSPRLHVMMTPAGRPWVWYG